MSDIYPITDDESQVTSRKNNTVGPPFDYYDESDGNNEEEMYDQDFDNHIHKNKSAGIFSKNIYQNEEDLEDNDEDFDDISLGLSELTE
jgi:hypothetical protein